MRELENLTTEEIERFLGSLTVELEYFERPGDWALNAEFLTGVRRNDELVGIGGVRKRFWFLPACFFVVKSRAQSQGFGTQLIQNTLNYARRKGYPLLYLNTSKKNTPAIELYRKNEFRTVSSVGHGFGMYYPLNRNRQVMRWLLFVAFTVHGVRQAMVDKVKGGNEPSRT